MALCYRTDSARHSDAGYPMAVTIDTAGELADYYEKNKDAYQFQLRHCGEQSMAEGVFGEGSGFGDEFFKDRSLLFVVLEEGSGSTRHRVESVLPENGGLTVSIERIVPEVGTADMAQWHIVLDLDKASAHMDIKVVLCDEYLS